MNHFYERISGWTQGALLDVYRDAVVAAPSDRPSVFVEIGSWLGRSTAFMAVEIINSGKPIRLHVVDHWRGDPADESQRSFLREHGSVSARWHFDKNMLEVSHVLTIHGQGSPADASDFADKSIEFCFIDGSHDEASVAADIVAWLPKIRSVLAGHDYHYAGVKAAVDRAFSGKVEIQEQCWKVKQQ